MSYVIYHISIVNGSYKHKATYNWAAPAGDEQPFAKHWKKAPAVDSPAGPAVLLMRKRRYTYTIGSKHGTQKKLALENQYLFYKTAGSCSCSLVEFLGGEQCSNAHQLQDDLVYRLRVCVCVYNAYIYIYTYT